MPAAVGTSVGGSNGRTGAGSGATLGAGGGRMRRPLESGGRDGVTAALRVSAATALGFALSRIVFGAATVTAGGFARADCDTGGVGSEATTSDRDGGIGPAESEAAAARSSAGAAGATTSSCCFSSVGAGAGGSGDVDGATGAGAGDCDGGIDADCGSAAAEASLREISNRCCTGSPLKNRAAP